MEKVYEKKIAFFHADVKDSKEALKLLADRFVEEGLADEDYYEQLLKRESDYPTGIVLNALNVALPHCDTSVSKSSQVGFMSLKEPVEFVEMGSDDKKIKASLIFMFTMTKTKDQLDMMMKFMETFKNDELMDRFMKVNDFEGYYRLIEEADLI